MCLNRTNEDTSQTMTSFDHQTVSLLSDALKQLDQGFSTLPDFTPEVDAEQIASVLSTVADRMQDNYPYQHPYYLGQMLKPPHSVARLAYALAMFINPNNHALDGGRASSAMEKEVVAELARMYGWEIHLGHLTGGGTLANMEGLWIAAEKMGRDKLIVASKQAHYTHKRLSEVLGLNFQPIAINSNGRMALDDLKRLLDTYDVGTVVATLGTTAIGSVDPLPAILELRDEYGFRIHVDSAYGGYFTLADNLAPHARAAYDAITQADSLAIDPHKHGLQPYGCGCVLFKDPSVGKFYSHDSPYTYFSSDELHLGEISLECSRAGAAAVGLWATHQMLPPVRGGQFAQDMAKCRAAALRLYEHIQADNRYITPFEPELDIVIWLPKANSVSDASAKAQYVFDTAAEQNIHLAVATLPVGLFEGQLEGWDVDTEYATCLRACVMKPEHINWIDEIWGKLQAIDPTA